METFKNIEKNNNEASKEDISGIIEDGDFIGRIINEFNIDIGKNSELIENIKKHKEILETSSLYQDLNEEERWAAFRDDVEYNILRKIKDV